MLAVFRPMGPLPWVSPRYTSCHPTCSLHCMDRYLDPFTMSVPCYPVRGGGGGAPGLQCHRQGFYLSMPLAAQSKHWTTIYIRSGTLFMTLDVSSAFLIEYCTLFSLILHAVLPNSTNLQSSRHNICFESIFRALVFFYSAH